VTILFYSLLFFRIVGLIFSKNLQKTLAILKSLLIKKAKHLKIKRLAFTLVVQPGLEPGAYGLEGRCSNPTELLNHPFSDCKNITSLFNLQVENEKKIKNVKFHAYKLCL
jgi:hypothetical protein